MIVPLPVVISARQWQHTESKKTYILGGRCEMSSASAQSALAMPFPFLGRYEAAFGSLCHARIQVRHGTESAMLAFSATCLLDSRAY